MLSFTLKGMVVNQHCQVSSMHSESKGSKDMGMTGNCTHFIMVSAYPEDMEEVLIPLS